MSAKPVAQRTFSVDGQEVVCSFFAPEAHEDYYRCHYEIEWAEGAKSRSVAGGDTVQALLLAMQEVHTNLLAARNIKQREVLWLDQHSLGLPFSESVAHWADDADQVPKS